MGVHDDDAMATLERWLENSRDEAKALRAEIEEALQLDGACSTLKEMAAASFEARLENGRLREALEYALSEYVGCRANGNPECQHGWLLSEECDARVDGNRVNCPDDTIRAALRGRISDED